MPLTREWAAVLDLVARQDPVEHLVVRVKPEHQDLVKAEHQDLERQDLPELALEHQDLPPVALAHLQVEHLVVPAQLAAEVAELAQPELSVREDHAVSRANPSGPREKNSNKEKHQALVAPWCHVAMAILFCDFAAEHQFRTLQTRLALTPAS